MAKYESKDAIVNRYSADFQQNSLIEYIANSLHISNQIDIKRTLEILNTTNNVNLQIKLFSVLSATIMLNNYANSEVIIKYSAVYDTINNVLAKGLARKAVHALNFLATLLYVDANDNSPTKQRTLALYAKNMTRTSGCLGTMTDMFTNNCMMYHDTWKALCLCLAAACAGSDLNQSYSSHMIPVCIQRCNQTNMDILLVLQSLLLNHSKNMELFLKCNGISVFTRELLHYDKCLHLLVTVVQYPTAVTFLLRQVQVLNDLQDFLRIYGPSSQIGQKAIIILDHIELRARGSRLNVTQESKKKIPNRTKSKENDANIGKPNECYEKIELDDTSTLMQNIMKEVFNMKQNEIGVFKKPVPKTQLNSFIRMPSTMISEKHRHNMELHITNTSNKPKKLFDQHRTYKIQRNNDSDHTFTELHYFNNGLGKNSGYRDNVEKSKILDQRRIYKKQCNNNTEQTFSELHYSKASISNKGHKDVGVKKSKLMDHLRAHKIPCNRNVKQTFPEVQNYNTSLSRNTNDEDAVEKSKLLNQQQTHTIQHINDSEQTFSELQNYDNGHSINKNHKDTVEKSKIFEQRTHKIQQNNDTDQTFSELQKYNNKYSKNRNYKDLEKSKIFSDTRADADTENNKSQTFIITKNYSPYINTILYDENPSSIDSRDFKPTFSSTLKHEEYQNHSDNRTFKRKLSFLAQSLKPLQRTMKVVKRRPQKTPWNEKIVNNKSLSSKLLSAINETCTTMVKTVANIFKRDESLDLSKDRSTTLVPRAEDDCSYSFLNYMQKRDLILNKLQLARNKDSTDFSLGSELCDTCDTHALRKKILKNEHLKQTVKKLKFGINLYGCDFKKISRTLWPREAHMTPTVLYNLYRKLLLK